MNIINCYGEQRRTKKEDVERRWGKLCKDMENIRMRKAFVCLGGDLNKLMGDG